MGVEEVMKFVMEKLKEALIAMENFGGDGVEKVMKFVVEKLKEALLAMENFGGDAFAWFNKIFPPGTRADKIHHWFHVAQPFLIAAVVLSVVVCFCRCCCGCCCKGVERMMKAPGKNRQSMPRRVFESNPQGYFRNLHACPGDQLC